MGLGNWDFAEPDDENQTVQLSEDAVILELLFRFCYPDRHPDLENLPFSTLTRLTEAVEKYNAFSGILICKIRMKNNLPHEAFDIFLYGANHDYTDIMTMAAPLVVLSTPPSKIVPALPVELHERWLQYYEKWLLILRDALSSSVLHNRSCRRGHCNPEACSNRILQCLSVGLESLKDLDAMFVLTNTCCTSHKTIFSSWRQSLEESIRNMPSFEPFTTQELQSRRYSLPSYSIFYPEGPIAVSRHFCASHSDVTFQSSDSVLFKIHKYHLAINAGGFAPSEFDASNEIVRLTEAGPTLDILFRFCYPEDRPDVEKLPFDDLVLLAEAAEKYQVYALMNICQICMKQQLPQHAMSILGYAARHNYPDILDIAAPLVVVRLTLSETLPILPPHLIMRWVEYFETVHLNMMGDRMEGPFPQFSSI